MSKLVLFSVFIGLALAQLNPSNLCPPRDGPYPVYFPDANCSLFWQCSNGVAYRFTCPAKLHFNPVLNVCDWPESAGCKANSTVSDNATLSNNSDNSTVTSTAPPNNDELCYRESPSCPEVDGWYPVYYAVPGNCSAFCQCSNGQGYYHPCPDGLYFNTRLNICDSPSRANCTV